MKMFVFDLDGTLLDSNRCMPSENMSYLNKLKNEGYKVVIATGRTLLSAYSRLNGDIVNYIISDTGAKIYDVDKKKFIYNNFISKKMLNNLLELYNNTILDFYVCSGGKYYKYSPLLNEDENIYNDKQKFLSDIDEVDHMGIDFKNNEDVSKMYNYIVNNYEDLECFIMQDSFDNIRWLEILPKGASKYNAISMLANTLNIPNEEIMAFGDSLNDVDMLSNCGCGVAMANALDTVKKAANYITLKNNEELGVIQFLREYLDEKEK